MTCSKFAPTSPKRTSNREGDKEVQCLHVSRPRKKNGRQEGVSASGGRGFSFGTLAAFAGDPICALWLTRPRGRLRWEFEKALGFVAVYNEAVFAGNLRKPWALSLYITRPRGRLCWKFEKALGFVAVYNQAVFAGHLRRPWALLLYITRPSLLGI